MKKIAALLLFLCCLLCACALAEGVPAEVLKPLTSRMGDGYEIMAYFYDPGCSRAHFVLSRDGRNQLAIVHRENGAYELELLAPHALRQGSAIPELKTDDDYYLYVVYRDDNGWEDQYNYHYTGSKWVLDFYSLATARDSFRTFTAYDGRLVYTYFEDLEAENRATIYGEYQRDVRYLNVEALPQTLQEAREKLSQPPSIPDGGLAAQNVKFTSGKKYPVYSGPGDDYLRAANGKAAVSTNDWIQVFGTEDGWALIQYDISSNQMRFGYIEASALPKNADVDELAFSPVDAYITRRTTLTDDPLNTLWVLETLPEGAWVTWLATMGEWAYVESSTGDLMRGFVPLDTISTHRVFDLSSHGFDGSAAAKGGTLTLQPDGAVLLVVDQWQAKAGQAPLRFEVYNEANMQLVLTAELDTSGAYRGSGLMENSWGVLICPVYAEGRADMGAALSVQW